VLKRNPMSRFIGVGLEMAVLEEAFRRSRQMNHGKVSAWLLSQFQL
jgi:hypothetical protein